MNKYVKFLSLALFAVLTISFVACSDDNDEPNGGNGGGGGSSQNYTFTVNGTTYYYGVKGPFGWDVGVGAFAEDDFDFIFLTVTGYEKQLTLSEEWDVGQGNLDINSVQIYISLKPFDVKSAKKGDVLEVYNEEKDFGIWPRLDYETTNASPTYFCTPTCNHKVTFVSYKKDILTINVENMSFLYDFGKRNGLPEQLELKGTLSFNMNSYL